MREILEFPKINENDISKVEELIDIIAENLDMDCSDELNELQKITGKNPQRSPLRLRFLNLTLRKICYVNGVVI